jgi:hypothetical protein
VNAPTVPTPPQRGARSRVAIWWFVWIVGIWLAFFGLLFAGVLDELWSSIRDLPLVVEAVLWILFLPWMLGMVVWTSSRAEWLRVVLVVAFAAGWTIISLPRRPSSRK